jgi:hypothetical protein
VWRGAFPRCHTGGSLRRGGRARFKAHAWRACVLEREPGVQIPPSPPSSVPDLIRFPTERIFGHARNPVPSRLRAQAATPDRLFANRTQPNAVKQQICPLIPAFRMLKESLPLPVVRPPRTLVSNPSRVPEPSIGEEGHSAKPADQLGLTTFNLVRPSHRRSKEAVYWYIEEIEIKVRSVHTKCSSNPRKFHGKLLVQQVSRRNQHPG